MSYAVATAFELVDSRQASRDSFRYSCVIYEAGTEVIARDTMLAAAPPSVGNRIRDDFRVEHQGADMWYGTLTYGPLGRMEEPDAQGVPFSTMSFEIGSSRMHVKVAKEHIGDYGGYPAPLNFHGLINVNSDGVAEGVDIMVPTFTWSETHNIPVLWIVAGYLQELRDLAATTNSVAFRGFAALEVLFLGASGATDGNITAPITYRFRAEKNASVTIGSPLPPDDPESGGYPITFDKKAHDYMWPSYKTVVEGVGESQVTVQRPRTAHVDRLYASGNWSGLIPYAPKG